MQPLDLLSAPLDAWACLNYERSRAPTSADAWQSWLRALAQRHLRRGRLASAQARLLAGAEAACAELGLRYPAEDAGQTAPWHLPERFLSIGPESLPEHPVVQGQRLSRWAREQGVAGPAAAAIQALCARAAAPDRWADVPVHRAAPALPDDARVAVCLHLFYPDLWPDIEAHLRFIPHPFDVYISVPVFSCTDAWADLARSFPRVRFLPMPNRGRDVAPWLSCLRAGVFDRYDAVCKLHGKRSPHTNHGDMWRHALLQSLLGSTANVAAVLAQFQAQPRLGLLGPANSLDLLVQANGWAKNRSQVRRWAGRLHVPLSESTAIFFPGTMFWFRPSALAPLRQGRCRLKDFPLEMGQTEGTLAHVLERLIPSLVQASGYSVQSWPA